MSSPRQIGVVTLIAFLLWGCGGGGGGGGGSPVDSTPSISNLAFTPASALQGAGNGTVTVTGSVKFVDAGGDLSTLHLTNPQGPSIAQAISGTAGQTSGTIQAVVSVSTQTLGHYVFSVFVSDTKGLISNSLTGSFDVNPNSTAMNWALQALPVPSGSTIMLKRVRWSRSLFVAVGDSIFTSPDAISWTERPVGLSATLMDVTWTGGQFVAVGDAGAILTSADGTVWTKQSIPAGIVAPILYGVASSSTRMVAVGKQSLIGGPTPDTGLVLTSTDGVTWTEVPAISSVLNAVAWSGTEFVAVGDAVNQPVAKAEALTSPDGVTWTSHDMETTTLLVPVDIASNGSRFVAVGAGGAAASADGSVWQEAAAGAGGGRYAVGWSGQGFLACGTVYCYSSTDGTQWLAGIQLPGTGPTVYGLAWGGSKWVAVGARSLVLTSP